LIFQGIIDVKLPLTTPEPVLDLGISPSHNELGDEEEEKKAEEDEDKETLKISRTVVQVIGWSGLT